MEELRAGSLTFDEYQEMATSTDRLIRSDPRLAFPLLGLFGEAGSPLSEVKKKQRDKVAYRGYEDSVIEEIGDFLWYLNAICCRTNIRPGYLAHNLDKATPEWQPAAPRDLKIVDIQSQGLRRASEPNLAFEQKLLKFAGEVGLLVTDHQAGRLEGNQAAAAGRLVAILRSLRAAAEEAGISLADAAVANIAKSLDRWPVSKRYPDLLDSGFPEHEQIPRRFALRLVENGGEGKRQVTPYFNGQPLGDKLTDNRMEDDDYHFHDAFHIAFASKSACAAYSSMDRNSERPRTGPPCTCSCNGFGGGFARQAGAVGASASRRL